VVPSANQEGLAVLCGGLAPHLSHDPSLARNINREKKKAKALREQGRFSINAK
jgi:hypothetical protein